MVVVITNLTDGPGKRPREVRIFNTRLMPGKSMRIQAQFVDSKMRAIEEAGHISIGAVPAWYTDHKSKRVLTPAEMVATRKRASDVAKAKADAKKKFMSGAPAAPAPVPAPSASASLSLEDAVPEPSDEVNTEKKSSKRKRR